MSEPPAHEDGDRLARQLHFVRELDRLKSVLRRTSLIDRSRQENTAEHSWHVTAMALTLFEYAPPGAELAHVVELLIVHDIVEIDAGDTFAFDVAANLGKKAREHAAATRLYGLLPADLAHHLRGCWTEFEAGETPSARFANALDRLQGLIANDTPGDGGTWRLHGVTRSQVLGRMAPIEEGAPGLWPVVVAAVARAVERGHVADK